jgi:hypothetical protein
VKEISRVVLLLAAVMCAALAVGAGLDALEIRAVAKRVDANQAQNQGHRAVSKEHWSYDITVQNKLFQPLSGLDVRYMVFYTTAELGSKETALQQHQSGNFTIDLLQSQERKGSATGPVELDKAHIIGRRHFINGGRIKAQDTLVGVWVRVYRGGQLIGEYANPSTLMKEHWQ